MGHNRLSNQLDTISKSELGINFDDIATWTKLENKLDQRKSIISPWLAATACLVLCLLSPIVVLKETFPTQAIEVNHIEVVSVAESSVEPSKVKTESRKIDQIPLYEVKRKSLEVVAFDDVVPQPMLEPISTIKEKQRPQFAAEDLSIIQASLERPSIRKGRTMTIRAQWQESSTKSKVENQALKIKLYETSNQ